MTRADATEFMALAGEAPIRVEYQLFGFEEANEALQAVGSDAVRGAAVLQMG
jgi:D-arabinose 1-dehydrogenase-like Zn-dependent alcohol dehydrogenase